MNRPYRDRVGLAWRDELALDMHIHLHELDCIEILAEREFSASRRRIDALRELALRIPVSLHGVALGLASSEAVAEKCLARMAELVRRIRPDHWSEHLAFVRAGGIEIGHLAAAPYNAEILEGTLRNVERARRVVGSAPHLENIATLLQPPGSGWSEEEFIGRAIRGAQAPLLLDLHNLYANAWNFGRDPFALLRAMPLDSVRSVHVSGGRFVRDASGRERLLDDHVHDPPDVVFELLECLAASTHGELTVIVERDGHYPPFSALLAQVKRVRAALAAGRCRRSEALAAA